MKHNEINIAISNKQGRIELIRFKVVNWLREFVMQKRFENKLKEMEDRFSNNEDRNTRFMSNQKEVTVDDVLMVLEKMDES